METLVIHLCYRLDITAISSGPQRRASVATMTCSNIAVRPALRLSLSANVICCQQDCRHLECPLT